MELMARLRQGEKLADLCREYGISRKTGNKFKKRFEEVGITGLQDQSRAPKMIPHKTPPEVVELIVAARKKHPTWGPRKIKETVQRRLGRMLPAPSTIGDILAFHGLVQPRKRRGKFTSTPTLLRDANAPNDTWCIDYKGHFRLGDTTYCYPLTLTDQFSRYILGCEGMGAISDEAARDVCESVFRMHGIPKVMRSDNGVPFASTGLAGLTQLSVYWLRLDIILERIRPASPQENAQHERMHRTLKAETTRPARTNLLQQQERFDEWVDEFNQQRPHEALDMKTPSDVYTPSTRPHPTKLEELTYPTHDDVLRVSSIGLVHLTGRRQIYLAKALTGQTVGIRETTPDRWLVTFAQLDLGHIEPNSNHFTPTPPPDLGT